MIIRAIVKLPGTATAVLALSALMSVAGASEPVQFPWGCQHSAPAATAGTPYQTLPRVTRHHTTAPSVHVPLQQLPPKTGYAYGWFGVNPGTNWGRHFGHSQNFTQWSSR